MDSYFDDKKRKYVVRADGSKQEFPEKPGMMDYVKEAFQPSDTRAQLEALRKRRQSNSGGQSY